MTTNESKATTKADIIQSLADYLDERVEHEVEVEEHGVVVHGDYELFGAKDSKMHAASFFAQELAVASYSTGVVTSAGETTGPFVVDKLSFIAAVEA